jgi:hypothetical protein
MVSRPRFHIAALLPSYGDRELRVVPDRLTRVKRIVQKRAWAAGACIFQTIPDRREGKRVGLYRRWQSSHLVDSRRQATIALARGNSPWGRARPEGPIHKWFRDGPAIGWFASGEGGVNGAVAGNPYISVDELFRRRRPDGVCAGFEPDDTGRLAVTRGDHAAAARGAAAIDRQR